MTVDTNTMVSITEANQNFSKVARLVDELGSVVILKNNAPRYLVIDFSKADDSAVAKDEDVLEISKRLLAQNKEAYEVHIPQELRIRSGGTERHSASS